LAHVTQQPLRPVRGVVSALYRVLQGGVGNLGLPAATSGQMIICLPSCHCVVTALLAIWNPLVDGEVAEDRLGPERQHRVAQRVGVRLPARRAVSAKELAAGVCVRGLKRGSAVEILQRHVLWTNSAALSALHPDQTLFDEAWPPGRRCYNKSSMTAAPRRPRMRRSWRTPEPCLRR